MEGKGDERGRVGVEEKVTGRWRFFWKSIHLDAHVFTFSPLVYASRVMV